MVWLDRGENSNAQGVGLCCQALPHEELEEVINSDEIGVKILSDPGVINVARYHVPLLLWA